jgi:hypothetical protein
VERLSCELGDTILIFGDFGDFLYKDFRERYLQFDIYQHHNADIENPAPSFYSP